MKIYLDTCVIQRPFDDKSQPRIALESEAAIALISLCEQGAFELVASDALVFEQEQNPNTRRKEFSRQILRLAKHLVISDDKVLQLAMEWNSRGLALLDALHLASAIVGNADYFCTTDRKLLNRAQQIGSSVIKIISPIELAKELT